MTRASCQSVALSCPGLPVTPPSTGRRAPALTPAGRSAPGQAPLPAKNLVSVQPLRQTGQLPSRPGWRRTGGAGRPIPGWGQPSPCPTHAAMLTVLLAAFLSSVHSLACLTLRAEEGRERPGGTALLAGLGHAGGRRPGQLRLHVLCPTMVRPRAGDAVPSPALAKRLPPRPGQQGELLPSLALTVSKPAGAASAIHPPPRGDPPATPTERPAVVSSQHKQTKPGPEGQKGQP